MTAIVTFIELFMSGLLRARSHQSRFSQSTHILRLRLISILLVQIAPFTLKIFKSRCGTYSSVELTKILVEVLGANEFSKLCFLNSWRTKLKIASLCQVRKN
jgi:hypothetical protein